ncbi:MAG: hypothetical protein CMN32_03570 [Saprospirales bacterium]|nr:hypothetical protein [Saprospirales bacterium]
MSRYLLLHKAKLLVLADQAMVSGGNFLVGVLLARALGLEGFGIFSLMWVGVLLALSLHQAFMTQPMMTFASKFMGRFKNRYRQGVFYIQALITIVLLLLTTVVTFIVRENPQWPHWTDYLPHAFLATTFYLLHDFLRKTFFIRKLFIAPLLMDGALYAVLFGSLLLFDVTIGIALLGYALGSILGLLIGVIVFVKNPDSVKGISFNWELKFQKAVKEHYHYSIWLLGTSVLQWFAGNIFLVAAASLLGPVAVGALRMAQNMVGLSHVLFLAMENIVPAEAARQFFTYGKKRMNAYLRQMTLLMSIPFVAILAMLSTLAPKLISWLYGPEYLPYNYLVSGYAVLYLFVFIGYPLRYALRSQAVTSPIFKAYLLSAIVSLALAFPLVGQFGDVGVIAGLMVSQFITLGVYVYYLRKKPAKPQAKEVPLEKAKKVNGEATKLAASSGT